MKLQPPRRPRRLILWITGCEMGEDYVAELDLEYSRRATRSPAGARLWYWRQLLHFDFARLALALRAPLRPDWHRLALPMLGWTPDLRVAARSLARQSRFSATAALTLALGIGIAGALFTVVDAVILRPLPYSLEDRLVSLRTDRSRTGGSPRSGFTRHGFEQLREHARSYERLDAQFGYPVNIHGRGEPITVRAARVTDGFFQTLGAHAALGRTFRRGDNAAAVVSDTLWTTRFGADPDLVGQSIQIEDLNPLMDVERATPSMSFTVIGVMPPEFEAPEYFGSAHARVQVWIPVDFEIALPFKHGGVEVVARLAPGVTLTEAESELGPFWRDWAKADPEAFRDRTPVVVPLRAMVLDSVRPLMWLLLAAVGILLAVVVANTSQLFLTWGHLRRPEMALRRALGATQVRLWRGAAFEAALTCTTGAVIGIGVAAVCLPALVAWMPPGVPRLNGASLDLRMIGAIGLFTTLVSLIGASVIAWASRTGDVDAVIGRARTQGAGTVRAQAGTVLVQVAISVVLLFGAAVAMRSFDQLTAVERGFDSAGRILFDLKLPQQRYASAAAKVAVTSDLYSRIEALPGVVAAGGTDQVPPVMWRGVNAFMSHAVDRAVESPLRTVTSHYPQAIGARLIEGRWFDSGDNLDSRRVIIVDEVAAERLWPNESPIGQEIWHQSFEPWGRRTVIGLVQAQATFRVDGQRIPQVYQPHEQDPWNQQRVVVHTTGDALSLAPTIRQVVHSVDPMLPVENLRLLDDYVVAVLAGPRFLRQILAAFALASVLLAAVGTFAVASFAVTTRVREIAVRMAVGAAPGAIARQFLRETSLVAVAGSALGLVGAAVAGNALAAHVFEVGPFDPASLLAAGTLAPSCAILAAGPVVRRAASTDPARVLEAE